MKRIAVIGGGIAGLAATHRVTELMPAAEVVVFEASDSLGGVLGTINEDGFLIETSADSFISNPPWAVDLCRRIGFADQLISTNTANRGAMVLAHGKLEPVPEKFLLMVPERLRPIFTSHILSWRGKLRLACERFVPPRHGDDDESVAAFARRRLGSEAFERLVQPLVGGIYTADPEKLSLAATLPRFIAMEQQYGSLRCAVKAKQKAEGGRRKAEQTITEDRRGTRDELDDLGASGDAGARYSMFVAPREGMSSFVATLSARLPSASVRLNTKIERIEPIDGQWSVAGGQSNSGSGELFDSLIIATPAAVAASLLSSVDGELARELSLIEYAGCAIAVLGYDRAQIRHPINSFGFVVPAVEGRSILSASFSSVKFPGRAA